MLNGIFRSPAKEITTNKKIIDHLIKFEYNNKYILITVYGSILVSLTKIIHNVINRGATHC